jgi:hypothetical protein
MSTTRVPPSTADALTVERDVLLIDELLPDADATLRVSTIAEADAAATWAAARSLDLLRVRTPLIAAAFWVRDMMDRVGRARRGDEAPAPPPERLTLDAGLPGWSLLGEQPGHEVVFGAVGRFWTGEITWRGLDGPEAFTTLDEPGWGRIAAGFSVRPYGQHRALVTYDVRTATTDADSRRRFLRYWALVRPFVAHLMRATNALIAQDAAATRAGGGDTPGPGGD